MPRIKKDIQQLCRTHTDGAVKTLVGIMNQPKAPAASRVMAANALLDRGYGKAMQSLEFEDVTKRVVGTDPIPENEWEAQYQDGPKTNGAKKNGNGTAA